MTGTGQLVRLVLRRDRVLLALWAYGFGLVPLYIEYSFAKLYPTAADLRKYADTSRHNGTFTALYGQVYGSTLGEMTSWRLGFVPLMVGLASLLTVVRHTRTEEEAGRRELLGSTAVGRQAGLAAALSTTFGANVVVAAVIAVAMLARGLPAAGSVALGLQFAAVGCVFAAVGAVAAQLTTGAGTARAIAAVALAVAYLLRLVGDVNAAGGGPLGWLTWVSPLGWAERIHPYGGNSWWLLGPAAALTAALTALAVALSARRDLGAGLLPPRLGPAAAGPSLRSPLALAWRLHRALLAGWLIGFALLGLVFGGVAGSIDSLLGDNNGLRDAFLRMGGRSQLLDAYFAASMSLVGIFAAGYAIQATLRLRAEEASGRAEPLLATAVGRLRWAASHLAFALLGPAAALAVAGLAAGLVRGGSTGDMGTDVGRVLAAALIQLPAVWVLAGVAVALAGLLPRWAVASWAALVICVLIGFIGSGLKLSLWLVDVSPFTHVPRLPGGAWSTTPVVVLVAVAVALGAAGLAGLRRRDIPVA